jgi:hypothetical protein
MRHVGPQSKSAGGFLCSAGSPSAA